MNRHLDRYGNCTIFWGRSTQESVLCKLVYFIYATDKVVSFLSFLQYTENCPVQQLCENGVRSYKQYTMLQHLNITSIYLWYTRYIESTKLHKPVQLPNLPPRSVAAHQHINGVYDQGQKWLGFDLELQQWGVLQNEILEQIWTIIPPAPD